MVRFRIQGFQMYRCPTCGARAFLGVATKQCANCGKVVCNKCVPQWEGQIAYKQSRENPSASAEYGVVGFCSANCFDTFWQRVFDFPVDYGVGTDVNNFYTNLLLVWNNTIEDSFEKCDIIQVNAWNLNN